MYTPRGSTRSIRSIALLAILGTALALPAGARAAANCGSTQHPAGEWRSSTHDLSNTRTQPLEDQISASTINSLRAEWSFSPVDAGGTGAFQASPVVADGCLFVGTDSGDVFALNADTGELVWHVKLPRGVFGLTVEDRKVFALVNQLNAPYAIALDEYSGQTVWTSAPIGTYPGYRTNSSAVVWNGMLFFGWSVPEGDAKAHAGFGIVDAATGAFLARTYVISPDTWQYGYGGGGIWPTAVIDTENGYAFAGTSNPTSKQVESPRTNAIVKIDMDRSRPTFGQIVDTYKGTYDQYYPGLDRQEACRQTGDKVLYFGFSVTCAQLDLDFGASPNLYRDAQNRLVVGELQKSGVFHAVYADTMQGAWTAVVAAPCVQCNFASSAFDKGQVFTIGTPPGQMVALDGTTGAHNWAAPIGTGVHHNPVSVANGVAYTVDQTGSLDAFDTTTGVPLAKRSLAADTGRPAAGVNASASASGVSIARHTIYAADYDTLVAYRLR